MSDYKIHTIDSAPEEAKDILSGAEKKFGFLPNLLGALAEAPALLKAYTTLSAIYEETSFSQTEKQIILLSTSFENNCSYCMAAHTGISKMQGVADDVITALREGTPITDNKLEALRAFAASVAVTRGYPDITLTRNFYDAGYSRQHALEVILGVGVKTLSNYANHLVDTPLDDNFANAKWEKPSN